ncbi:MAG TPA: hypothetical protein VGR89_03760, partial [Puia sp.]|nr:hypothetical protein [Puia sp.]
TVFPELTTYGRTFKLNGYTTTNTDSVKDSTDTGGTRLDIDAVPPLSAMLQISDAFVKKPASTAAGTADLAGDQNGSLEFPTQFSLFYAGRIAPQMGAFVQFTYDSQSGSFGWDNTDVRFADRIQVANTDLVYGLTANNNPTVQDVFNTIPAWSFPYFAAKSGNGPLALTQLESLGANVGGLGGYIFWNQLLYAEISAYRSAPQGFGGAGPDSYNAIQGFAPYWRVALTQDFDKNSAEVGIFGMDEHSIPNSELILGPQDHYSDFGVDAQYQYVSQEHCFTLKGSEIWENQAWDYSNGVGLTGGGAVPANPTDTLRSFKVDATYYYNREIGATVGYFSTTGSADGGIYPASSNTALTPDTEGFITEINFVPWYNTKFSLQYTYFTKFNGSVDNYDAAGGHATDNNTLVASAWLMY